jgi:signal transduction histidine kinase
MRERLQVLGGRLTATTTQDGGFVLEAAVPVPAHAMAGEVDR